MPISNLRAGDDPYGPGSSGDASYGGEGGGSNWLQSILGSLGGLSGALGPLLQAGGALAGGAIGSNASSDAARLQANALNRGMDLQTAQWLQQQANQAPWLQAGQQALPQLMKLAGQEPPGAFQGPPSISGAGYALPAIAPTWGPQGYQGPQRPGGAGGAGPTGGSFGFGGGDAFANPASEQERLRGMAQAGGPAASPSTAAPGGDALGNVDWSTVRKGENVGFNQAPNAMMTHGGQGAGGAGGGGGGIWGVPNPDDYRYTPGQVPSAAANRWTPGQGPRAQDYRYTPGQTPDAAQYQSGPPQLYQGAMPGTQVSQLTGQQVLDQDPGAAFRQSEARKALEGSAAARGDLLSGGTLQALQSRSQDLASQEYGNAWQRMMARDTEQYGRDWGQYQQHWNQGVQGTQLGLQTNAQNFGQAMSAAQLREQVNQVASQQGWSQAQTEAAFREQMAQQASQQGWGQQMGEAGLREQLAQAASQQGFQQALAGQGQAWQQGFAGQQWEQQQRQAYDQSVYDRMMQQSGMQYGRDVAQNETDYQRQLAQYNSQQQNQNTQWNRLAGLAGVGQTAANQLGVGGQNSANTMASLLAQLGIAQGTGAAGSGMAWNRALGGVANQLPSILGSLNR